MKANHVLRRIWYLLLVTLLMPRSTIWAESPADCHSNIGTDW
jgi:hypothetical protein